MYAYALRRMIFMSNKTGIMSERLKEEIARELGVYNIVQQQGWGSVSSRNCGNMVKKAIEKANKNYH
jgi:small acid-soluble spore protein F (minor alpha/beta-type SASP)